ncbi:histidine kinase [Aliikangiella sp. GXAS 306]
MALIATILDANRSGTDPEIAHKIVSYLISFVPWMLITPIFYWLLQRAQEKKTLSILATSSLLFIVWSPFTILIETISYRYMRQAFDKTLLEVFLSLPLFVWVFCVLLFSAVLGACLAVLYYRRYNANRLEALRAKQTNIELELQLSEFRIQSLLSQLEPHFLFNALNSIASLVRISDKKQALSAISRLSDLLRYALEASSQKLVNFENELEFVKDYLSLQSLRFEDKLAINIIDNRAIKNQECPPFLLQTFVENAIKHGLEAQGQQMVLTIEISATAKDLSLKVANTHQPAEHSESGFGIGLTNLKARLDILYQQDIAFKTHQDAQQYQVALTLPVQG